jgi:Flp pilus assembly protein TadD
MHAASRRLATLLALGATLLAGCASVPDRAPRLPPELLMDAAFAPPTRPVDPAAVFALSPAMKRYLEVEIASMLRTQGRHRGLVEALHSKAHLRLDYDTELTRTASEAFDARAGNCLSLVVMTAALAKHLDLPIQYQALVGQETWSRDGTLSFVNGHVNITVGKRLVDRIQGIETDSALRLDFGGLAAGRGAWLRAVSEGTITAMFMNNRAAESLVQGDAAQAYAYAREAVRQDPHFASGYNTLGVIYRQQGLVEAAERALRHTLSLEADHHAALDNLARLYETQGREAEAAPLRQALKSLEREPPFLHFDLAREAVARGDYASARDHLLRELKRDPDYHEFHYWLAIALAGLGDARGASQHLASAMDNSTTRRDHALYAGKLARLKSAQRVN